MFDFDVMPSPNAVGAFVDDSDPLDEPCIRMTEMIALRYPMLSTAMFPRRPSASLRAGLDLLDLFGGS